MSPKTSLCQGIDCRLINAELEFYEQAHCLLDGEPGIDNNVPYKNFQWGEAEIEKLGHHSVSEPLREEYRRAAEEIRSSYTWRAMDFSRLMNERTFWGTYMSSAFQWEAIFVKLLTDTASPVRFDPVKSLISDTLPSVWAVRLDMEPIKIIFETSTDLQIPSKEADRLMAFINARLEKAGIHLPRKFKIERGIEWPDNSHHRYEIFIPKGECSKPEDQDVS